MSDLPMPVPATDAGCHQCGVSRRDFVSRSALVVLGAAVATACGDGSTGPTVSTNGAGVTVLGSVITIDLAVATTLSQANGGILVSTAGAPVLVLNAGGGSYRALNGVCPHEGRTNGWSFNGSQVECVFHGMTFNTSGTRLSGPSSASLRAYTTAVSGNTLTVTIT